MSTTAISIVIPTRGRAETLRATLDALARQRYDVARMEVIVVMDGACASTRAMVDALRPRFPTRLELLEQPRAGQGSARNRGVASAAAPIILLLDDDIIAAPELVAAHTAHHGATGETGDMIVTGDLPVEPVPDEGAHYRALREWWEKELHAKASPEHRFTFRDFVTGNVSFSRVRMLEVGGFDPIFSGYGREDYEMGYRMLRAGARMVHEPRAVGVHRYRKQPREWLRQTYSQGKADVIFARKHPEIVQEVMGLSPFPAVPWLPWYVAAHEQRALALNGGGGRRWRHSAAVVQAAYYWRGVRELVGGARELAWLMRGQHAALRARGRPVGIRHRAMSWMAVAGAATRGQRGTTPAAGTADTRGTVEAP